LEYDLQGFYVGIYDGSAVNNVITISNQDISSIVFKNGTIDLAETSLFLVGFESVVF